MRPITQWRALAMPVIVLIVGGLAAGACESTVAETGEPKAPITTTTKASTPKGGRKSKTTTHASTATAKATTTDSTRTSVPITTSSDGSTSDSASDSTTSGNTATPDNAVAEELSTKSNLPDQAKNLWRVGQGEVRVICPMTVGGSFDAKTTSLTASVAPGASRHPSYLGNFSVDLRTLDTGIDMRNEHLRTTYLEVAKGDGFERAVFSDISLGEVDPETFQGQTSFTGTFLLHGVRKTVTGHAKIRRSSSSVRVEASFPVTLADYGIAKPQYLGVGVKSQVQVKVAFVATPVAASAGVSQ